MDLSQFAGDSLVIRSPGRINLIGEHTDYNCGLCLPAAISQALYFGIRPASEINVIALNYKEQTDFRSDRYSWEIYFRGVIKLLKDEGIDLPPFAIQFGGDLPAGAGLSSSSSIVSGFIFILNEFFSLGFEISKLTEFAVRAERANGLLGGMMDQICIMNGQASHALLIDCNSWKYQTVPCDLPDFSWLVVDTRVKHNLVKSDYNSRSLACSGIKAKLKKAEFINQTLSELSQEQLSDTRKILTPVENNYLRYIVEENERVKNFVDAIHSSDIHLLGELLLAGHDGLRQLYKVSCTELDFLVEFAKENKYCYGARLTGGGFGGSTIHLVPKEFQIEYTRSIQMAYYHRFGYLPDIFVAQFEKGVSVYS